MGWVIRVRNSPGRPALKLSGTLTRGLLSDSWTSSPRIRQPLTVIRTSREVAHTLPSALRATATTCWVSLRRTRVETSGLPARGVRWNTAISGLGLPLANRWMLST